ncbi:MAG: AraC family transcriptional regulator [Lentisphaerae bacterium]|nr:MAG: AraC family transcriptional regulator [Lentisphaerota bacterium]
MHNTQNIPALYHSQVELDESFPLKAHLDGVRDDGPIDAYHTHNVLEVGLCLEGSGLYHVGGKVIPFRQGDISLITPLEWHRSQSTPGSVSRWHWLFFDPVRLFLPFLSQPIPYNPQWYAGAGFCNILSGSQYPQLVSVFEEALAEVMRGGPGMRDNVRALLLVFMNRLFHAVGRFYSTGQPQVVNPIRIMPALDMLTRNYRMPLRIADLARACHMSLRNFQLHFRRCTGQSPQAFLIHCRLQAAVTLLRGTDLPIAEIAYQCGFGSLSSFNRAFRSQFRKSPREYRSSVNK